MGKLLHEIIKKCLHAFWMTLFYGCVVAAVLLSTMRIMMPYVSRYLEPVEQLIHKETGLVADIGRMDAGWQGFGPALRLEQVVLKDEKTKSVVVSFRNIDVQLDLIRSLLNFKLIPGRLKLQGMDLKLPDNGNLNTGFVHELSGELQKTNVPMLALATQFRRLLVVDSIITVPMKQGKPVIFAIKTLRLNAGLKGYRFETQIVGLEANSKAKISAIADITGDIEAIDSLQLDGYFSVAGLNYDPRWMPSSLDNLSFKSGLIDVGVWFNWHDNQWHKVMGKFNLDKVLVANQNDPKLNASMQLKGGIAWERAGGDFWRLTGDGIQFKLGERESPAAAFLLQGGPFDPWELKIDKFSLADLTDLYMLELNINPEMKEVLSHVKPDAMINQLQAKWLPTAEGIQSWQAAFQIVNWSNQGYKEIPAINGLNGEVKIDDKFGQLQIDSKNVIMTMPSQLSMPMEVKELTGIISWHHDKTWAIHAPQLKLSYEDMTLESSINFEMADHIADSLLQVTAKSSAFDYVTAQKLLPTDLIPESVIQWIHESVNKGTIEGMTILVDGPIGKMPFKQNEGKFEIRMDLRDFELNYLPHWPIITDLSGELVIDGSNFKGYADHGFIYHSALNQTVVTIPLLKKPQPLMMAIKGNVQGSAEDGRNFILNSPLVDTLGDVFQSMSVTGALDLDLNLGIPLRGEKLESTIDGVAKLSGAAITVNDWNLKLSDIDGSMHFTDQYYDANNIKATVFDVPASLSIKKQKAGKGYRMDWTLSSYFSDAQLKKQVPHDALDLVKGEAPYSLQYSTYIPKQTQQNALSLNSELKGIEIKAPAPLGKEAKDVVPTRILFPLKDKEGTQTFALTYGKRMAALFDIKQVNKQYALERAQIALGDKLPNHFDIQKGLHIVGQTPSLNVTEWIDFIEGYQKQYKSTSENFPFSTDALIERLDYRDITLNHARTRLSRAGTDWLVNLDSKQINGRITVPDKPTLEKPIVFDLSSCNWVLKTSPDVKTKVDLKTIPPVNFSCADTTLSDHPFGAVEVRVRPLLGQVVFDPIKMAGAQDSMNASMTWNESAGTQYSSIKGEINSKDIHDSLVVWGIKSDVRGAQGDFKFDLNWPGGPQNFKVAQLTGNVNVDMSKGRFVSVDPGMGRILGLLSLQGITRRLRLDFSDVFQKGFGFDSVRADVIIANAYAVTENAKIKAPAANIDINGKMGLDNKQLDMDLYVHANVDSTVPALGAAVALANPAVGAAVWVADKMFNPLGGLGQYHYHVSGTWSDPVYKDLSETYRQKLKQQAPVVEAKPR